MILVTFSFKPRSNSRRSFGVDVAVSSRSTLKLVPSGLMLTRFDASISRLIGRLTGPLQVTKVPLAALAAHQTFAGQVREGLANRDDADAEGGAPDPTRQATGTPRAIRPIKYRRGYPS